VSQPQGDGKKSFWERAQAPVGVVSGILGLFIAVIGVPDKVQSALGLSTQAKTDRIELEQERADLASAGPRLEASYLFLATDLVGPDSSQSARRTSKQAVTLLSFPSIRNEILHQEYSNAKGCKLGKQPQNSVAFLVVENRGKRDAANVTVVADRLRLAGHVRVDESGRSGGDYVANLRARTRRAAPITVSIPRTIAPGEGVRVPIWVSAENYDDADHWCVVSSTAFQPTSVHFVDPVLSSQLKINVRRLESPEILGEGVEARG
jgi:hypothetical protein